MLVTFVIFVSLYILEVRLNGWHELDDPGSQFVDSIVEKTLPKDASDFVDVNDKEQNVYAIWNSELAGHDCSSMNALTRERIYYEPRRHLFVNEDATAKSTDFRNAEVLYQVGNCWVAVQGGFERLASGEMKITHFKISRVRKDRRQALYRAFQYR